MKSIVNPTGRLTPTVFEHWFVLASFSVLGIACRVCLTALSHQVASEATWLPKRQPSYVCRSELHAEDLAVLLKVRSGAKLASSPFT